MDLDGFLPNISIDLMVIGRIDARMLDRFKGLTEKPQGNHRLLRAGFTIRTN